MADPTLQLTHARYRLPHYAQGAIWATTVTEAAPVDGAEGTIALAAPDRHLILRWQAQDGPALVSLVWQGETPAWEGSVRVGGYADAIHLCALPNTGEYVHMLYLGGQPLQYRPSSLSRAHNHLNLLGRSPDFHHRMALDLSETVTTWLIPQNSPLAQQITTAMLSNARMHLFGRLAEDNHPYADYFMMPLILEAVTLFSS